MSLTHPARCVVASLLLVLACLVAPVVAPVAASAHTELESATPAAEAVVRAVPDEVVLTFSEDLGTESDLAVTGPGGTSVAASAAEVDGPAISIAIAPDAPSGTWTVGYRVISADGHPVTGQYTFTVEVPTPEATTPAASPTAASTTPATTAPATPTATDVTSAADDDPSGGGGATWWIVAVVVVALLAAAVGFALSRRRRS